MSKSKGNAVTTDDVIEKYGRDVLRYYLLSSPSWDDFYFNWADVESIAKSFIVIENTFNFVKTYVKNQGKKKNLKIEDQWILSRLNCLIENCTGYFKTYNCHKAAQEIHAFIINDFSRWYIKLIRNRTWPAYEGKDKAAAFYTLMEVTRTVSRLIAPICPFLAEHAHQIADQDQSVHIGGWPTTNKKLINKKLEKNMETAKKVVELANSIRKENGIKLRWPLKTMAINKQLKGMEKLIAEISNVKKVEFKPKLENGKEMENIRVCLDTEITDDLKKEALLREVIRKVQDMRKNNGYVVKDRITLFISTDELKQFEKEIKKAVGAAEIRYEMPEKGSEVLFEDMKIDIYIRRK
jgi:isoleucyl-tRNA synthetase